MIRLNKTKISCPIFLAKEELVLKDIIKQANGTFTEEDKDCKLEELGGEIGSLLSCPASNRIAHQCEMCRAICKLRIGVLSFEKLGAKLIQN